MACHGRVLRERQVPWLKTDDFDESLLLDLNAGEDGDVLKNLRDLPSVLEDALGECAHAKKLATAVQAVCSTTADQIESVKVCMSSQSSSSSRSSWAREAGSKTALGQSVQHIREAASRHMASLRQSLSFNPAVAAGAWKASPQAAYKTTTHDKHKKQKASEAKKEAEDTVRKESREHRPARPTPHLRGFQQSLAAASAAAVPPPPPLASAPRSSAPPSIKAPAARRSRRQEKRDSATTLRSPSPLRGEEEKDGTHTASYGASRSSSRDEARARAAGDESGRSSSSDQDGQLHALKFISGKFLLHADPDEEDLGQPEEEAKGGALPPAPAQQTRLIAEVRPTHQPVAAEQLAEAFFASRGPANEAARDMAWSGVGALENKSEDDDEREEEEPEEAEAPKHRSLRCHLLFSSPLCMERPISLGLSCKGAPSKDAVEALCRDFGLEFRSLEPAVLSSVTGEAALWNRRHKHAEAMIQPGDELFKVFLRARREDACPEVAHPPPASGPSESPSRSVAPMIVPGAPVEILAQGQGPGTLVAQLVHRVPALAKVPEVQLQLVFKGMRPLPQLQVEEEVAEVRQSGCEVLPSAATSQNLRHLIARADCEVLHLALHCSSGQARHLFLEDPQGKAHIMTAEDFQSLLTDGQASQCVKLVVLNACHSFAVGQHFVQAGVKHVVCVQDDKEVRDNSCRLFARNFFSALRAGRSIGESFGCGVASLRHSSDGMCQKDAGSFVLLPEGGDHNVVLAGVAATLPSSASPRWLPARVEDFMGREVDIWRLLCHLKSRRLVTLSGSKGIGKTALMVAAGRFVQMRRGDSFQDGFQEVYWLNGDIPSKISESLQDLLRALQEDPSILVLADVPSVSSNNLPLKQLLEANAKVRLVLEVADASPNLKDQLGSLNVKPTKMELGPLQPLAQARLFLCRAARPLYDFELSGEPGANVPSTPPKIAEGFGQALGDHMVLAELPWMRDFEGNPSRIVDAAQALKPWKAAKPDEARPAKGKFVKVLAVHPNGEADKLLLRDTMTMAEIIETKAPGELRAVELEVLIDDFLVPPDATLRDFLDEDRSSGPITLQFRKKSCSL